MPIAERGVALGVRVLPCTDGVKHARTVGRHRDAANGLETHDVAVVEAFRLGEGA